MAATAGSTRILVVEDSATQAEQVRGFLESEGFAVDLAADGRVALARCHDLHYDLVLTDILMPEMDGYELCARIKADPATRALPVILLTTLSDLTDIVHGLECGADNFVSKPYDPPGLIARIRHILANRGVRTTNRVKVAVEVFLIGKRFTVTSDIEQILDFLVSTFEEFARAKQLEFESKLAVARRELEEQILRFFTQASDLLCITGFDGRFKHLNPAWERTLGYTVDELKAQPLLEFVHPDDRAPALAECRRLQEGARSGTCEDRFRCKDGSYRCLVWSLTSYPEERLIYGVARDVTETRQLEQQFRQAQKMESLGLLAGGVAHDFNNLLGAIVGFAELISLRQDLPEPVPEYARQIRMAGDSAAALTRRLLTFSRKQVVQTEPLDLNALITELRKLLRRVIGETIDLVVMPAPQLGRVQADRGQLEQVLMNLAVNARDAMPQGGCLTLETQRVELDAEYARTHRDVKPGPHALLAVSDTGCGMDAATQARLFEPFFTTKAPGQGTGLGLATVYGIVRQHGGHIWVYSEVGRGTTFKIYLPLVTADAPVSAPAPVEAEAMPGGTETVLVAEDSAAVLLLAQEVLATAGYTVLTATGPEEALRVAERHAGPIHLLLSDVVMPGMDGLELARRLAAQRPDVKVVYMSGYTGTATIPNGGAARSGAFLQKPFAPGPLLRKVREVLGGR